jgi:hypothetical protein
VERWWESSKIGGAAYCGSKGDQGEEETTGVHRDIMEVDEEVVWGMNLNSRKDNQECSRSRCDEIKICEVAQS